jgi:hypothetical protein
MIANPFYITNTLREIPLRILILGDNTGGFSTSHIEASRAIYNMLPNQADYCIHVGDIYDGRNDTYDWPYAEPMKYYSDFLNYFNVQGTHEPVYPLSSTLRFFPTVGNHDILVVPSGVEVKGTTFKNWFNLTSLHYSINLSNVVEFFILNTTSADTPDGEAS